MLRVRFILIGGLTPNFHPWQSVGESARSKEDAQAILVTLLSSLSRFWGVGELVRLVRFSLGTCPTSLTLRKALAKRIPAKQLLPAMFRVWSELPEVDAVSVRLNNVAADQ